MPRSTKSGLRGGQDFDSLLLEEEEPISSRCMSPDLQTLVQITMRNSSVGSTLLTDTGPTFPA